ncbi:unnamed protein product [Pedinophyceae sp. YPF-701]|nr:unnamed protein product [Pedinophyceae sp. YPF-701]
MEDNGRPIKGRIYVSPQGINAQFSGKYGPCKAYMDFVQQQPGFASVSWGWERVTGHMYPRLRLQTKPALVSMSGGTLQYELHDQAARCDHLEPEQWKSMIKLARTLKTKDQAGAAAAAPPSEVDVGALPEDIRERAARGDLRDIVVLDLRNDYEWDVGHFEGAERPRETEFRETPTEGQVPAYMEGVDRDTPVVMYCTGGIRCDIYSAYLREKGYDNVYALKGGVHGYFREQGGEGWNGSLFVFDGRMAVPAAKPDDAEAMLAAQSAADDTQDVSSPYAALPAAVPCQICGGERSNGAMAEAPPINCANIDCNKLVLACRACKEHLKCCCSENCLHNAPRMVRPAKPTGGNYGKWSRYAESDAVVTAGGIKSQEARARAAASGMGPLAGARGREPQANA